MNILHKLGLYKKSEIDEVISKTANIVGSMDEVFSKLRDTEDCYKAVLAMYNDAQTVEHAVRVIQHYCENTICYDCDYANGGCVFANTAPCAWEVSK